MVPTPPALIDPETSRGSIIKVYALSAGQHKEFKADAERQGILWVGLGMGGAGFGGGAPQQYPSYEAKQPDLMQQPFGGMGQQQQMQMPQQQQQQQPQRQYGLQYKNPNSLLGANFDQNTNNFVQPVPQNIEMVQRPPGALPSAPVMMVAPVPVMAWTCPHCTVVNDPSATICCVCSKSRPTAVAGGGAQAGAKGIMAGALGF